MSICTSAQEPKHGSCIIITDLSRFIVERKNRQSVNDPNYGKLCLFGGRSNRGESPRRCLKRELEEELIDMKVVDQVLARAVPWMYYPASESPSAGGSHNLWVYICVVDSRILSRWIQRLDKANIHQEGYVEVLDRGLLQDTCRHSGCYVASLEIVFNDFLRQHQRN